MPLVARTGPVLAHNGMFMGHLAETNNDFAAVFNLWDLETKLRSKLETVDRKQAPGWGWGWG